MKILIIGSHGFIGSNAVDYFTKQGHVLVECDVVHRVQSNYYTIHNAAADFDTIFSQHQFDVCINASGLANVQVSFQQPLLDFELNVQNVYTILSCIQKHNPTCKFINFSSAAVYGNPLTLPIGEGAEINTLSPYGTHKHYSEQICTEFYKYFSIPTCSLRVFSAYGPGLTKQLFWDLYKKQEGLDVIDLFGSGDETRDFIYITDLLNALDCVITKGTFEGDCINIANGIEHSIKEVATYFIRLFAEKKQIEFTGGVKLGDPLNWRADISLLRSLGYSQKISMEEGLRSYKEWIQEKK